MAYLLEKAKSCFKDHVYYGIYYNNGIVVAKSKWTSSDVLSWLNNFQTKINKIAGDKFLQFTAVVWGSDVGRKSDCGRVTVESSSKLPYLDMELMWDQDGNLQFGVHLKPNQKLKYLDTTSTHTPHCFKAIVSGVYQ